MKQKFRYIFFLFFCCTTFLNAQQQNDSLAKYSYEELKEAFLNTTEPLYVEKYLRKAKKDNDSIKIARAYYYYTTILEVEIALEYSDSIILVSSHIYDHNKYPVLGYYSRGIMLYNLGRNKEALDNYLIALKLLKVNKNESLEIEITNIIYGLKDNWKNNNLSVESAERYLKLLEDQKEFFVKSDIPIYLNAILNLGKSYIENKKVDEGLNIAERGILETKETNSLNEYYDFVSLAGTAHYYLKNYNTAIDSLNKALPHRKDHGKAMNNYYLAKSYDKLKQPEKAHFHFLKTDSIYQATKDVFPEMRIAYEHIIDYYKSKNDVENQIKYYDRLIETDAKIDSTYTYVTETIQKKFETPQAIAERNRLLEEAQEKENAWKYSFGIISAILLLISGVLFYVFRRQKYYKKRFEEVMNISTPLNVLNTSPEVLETRIERSRNALNVNPEALEGKKDIDVPEATIEDILKKLSKFEVSKGFTKQISLTELAKKLGTNQKYLSKVINWHYEKSYSAYINELRVHYAISKLKEETTFRNYTIKAIAKEVGFGNVESFAKAFYKFTGINPSYFIKRLNERLDS